MQFKKLKDLLNLIRAIRIDEILNTKVNTNMKIEQILKKFEKNLKMVKFNNKSSRRLPSTNYFW